MGSRAEVVGRCGSLVILSTASRRESKRVLQMKSTMQGDRFSMREKGGCCQELKSRHKKRDITGPKSPHRDSARKTGKKVDQVSGWDSKNAGTSRTLP